MVLLPLFFCVMCFSCSNDIDKDIVISNITIQNKNIIMEKGTTMSITYSVNPNNATEKVLIWTSSDQSIVSVDSYGKVFAHKAGEAIIKASSSNGVSADCSIKVIVSITSISLNKDEITINVGESNNLLTTITPEDATDIKLCWTSSDDNIVSVSSIGEIIGIAEGESIVTVNTEDKKFEASCKVIVKSAKQDNILENQNKWSWAQDGNVIWGNAGHSGFGANYGRTSIDGLWWGVHNATELNDQLVHSGGKSYGDENNDAYMVFKDGYVSSYTANGSKIREGSYELNVYPDGRHEGWELGKLTTSTPALLFPWSINEEGKAVTNFDIMYLDSNNMTLVYTKGNAAGSWSEITFWRFQSDKPQTNNDFEASQPSGFEKGHGYVDLGLPSGNLWATCNLGATNPNEKGLFYAWGETRGYKEDTEHDFTYVNYSLSGVLGHMYYFYTTSEEYTFIDLPVDNITELRSGDDAAHYSWGGSWKMPNADDIKELSSNCFHTWGSLQGVKGSLLTSKINGNSIFIPAAGSFRYNQYNSWNAYWTSTLNASKCSEAITLYLDSDSGLFTIPGNRYDGYPIRAIIKP